MESACLSIGGVAMNYQESENFIHSFRRFTKEPGLKGIRTLLSFLGDPQKKLRFIHIAGTNGKGSTTAMCASVLQEAGYRTRYVCFPLCADLSGTNPGGWTDDSGDRDGGFM